MITDTLFAQYKPAANETVDLYTVPDGSTAMGTLWIAAQAGFDIIRVQLIASTIQLVPPVDPIPDAATYILYDTPLVGNVPIYLQQIHLNQGDTIRINSQAGDCSFTFTGERYS